MFPEVGKALHHQQAARCFYRRNFFMLQNPGVSVGHEYGVDAGCQGWVDIRLGTVSNHPRGVRRQRVFRNYFSISCSILLRDDLYGRKMSFQSGALNFAGLFSDGALGHQDQSMPSGEVLQRFWHIWKDLDWMLGDGMGKSRDGLVQSWCERLDSQPFE